jgi:hypothetical protein
VYGKSHFQIAITKNIHTLLLVYNNTTATIRLSKISENKNMVTIIGLRVYYAHNPLCKCFKCNDFHNFSNVALCKSVCKKRGG